jgi:hypothetical protein
MRRFSTFVFSSCSKAIFGEEFVYGVTKRRWVIRHGEL